MPGRLDMRLFSFARLLHNLYYVKLRVFYSANLAEIVLRSPLHPSAMSCQLLSKLRVYHGSATS